MTVFLKSIGLALIALILGISIEKKEKDFATLLSITACCILAVAAISWLKPILDFIWRVFPGTQLDNSLLETLLKAVGIGLAAEVAGMICTDGGNGSLAKVLRILGAAIILNLSIPLMETLLSFIQEMLYNI